MDYVAGHTQAFISKALKCDSCIISITANQYLTESLEKLLKYRQFENCKLTIPSRVVSDITRSVVSHLYSYELIFKQ